MKADFDIMALMPEDTPAYMAPAWLGCIHWAVGNDEIMAAFRAETGNAWVPASDGLGRLIDEATGADVAFFTAFVQWVNVNVWGPIDGEAAGQETVRG